MAETSYYVYALKDPRSSPARAFYIGKGTGTGAHDHMLRPDESSKGMVIRVIQDSGYQVLVSRLVEDLSEIQAIKLEADTNLCLRNAVAEGCACYASSHRPIRRAITNSDAASLLGLRSDYGGGSKDYLSYSLIGLLMRDGLLKRDRTSKRHVATTA